MNIAVIGASGKSGRLILKEALSRGHQLTAIVRDKKKVDEANIKVIEKDLFALSYEDLKDQDVIIDAFAAWTEDTLPLHESSLKHLADLLSGKPNRLLVVGGAGSLFVDPGHRLRLMDTPDFPDAYKPLSQSMGKAFDMLRTRHDVRWTYLSPSADFAADGPKSGHYRAGKDELLVNAKGQSLISYADYATAMIDEAENPRHIQERFTVVSE